MAEPVGGERPSRIEAREEPRGGRRGADADVGTAIAGEASQQASEGLGNLDVRGSQVQSEGVVGDSDLVAGERDDARQLLSVEQDETAGDSIGELNVIVVEEAAHNSPAGVVVVEDRAFSPDGPGDGEVIDEPVVGAVGLGSGADGGRDGVELAIEDADQRAGAYLQSAAHAVAVVVGALLDSTAATPRQAGDTSAVRAEPSARPRRVHEATFGVAAVAVASPAESGAVAGLTHRPFWPGHAGRAALRAVSASQVASRRCSRRGRVAPR